MKIVLAKNVLQKVFLLTMVLVMALLLVPALASASELVLSSTDGISFYGGSVTLDNYKFPIDEGSIIYNEAAYSGYVLVLDGVPQGHIPALRLGFDSENNLSVDADKITLTDSSGDLISVATPVVSVAGYARFNMDTNSFQYYRLALGELHTWTIKAEAISDGTSKWPSVDTTISFSLEMPEKKGTLLVAKKYGDHVQGSLADSYFDSLPLFASGAPILIGETSIVPTVGERMVRVTVGSMDFHSASLENYKDHVVLVEVGDTLNTNLLTGDIIFDFSGSFQEDFFLHFPS